MGYFVWKITILRQKNHFFSNFRGGVLHPLNTHVESTSFNPCVNFPFYLYIFRAISKIQLKHLVSSTNNHLDLNPVYFVFVFRYMYMYPWTEIKMLQPTFKTIEIIYRGMWTLIKKKKQFAWFKNLCIHVKTIVSIKIFTFCTIKDTVVNSAKDPNIGKWILTFYQTKIENNVLIANFNRFMSL